MGKSPKNIKINLSQGTSSSLAESINQISTVIPWLSIDPRAMLGHEAMSFIKSVDVSKFKTIAGRFANAQQAQVNAIIDGVCSDDTGDTADNSTGHICFRLNIEDVCNESVDEIANIMKNLQKRGINLTLELLCSMHVEEWAQSLTPAKIISIIAAHKNGFPQKPQPANTPTDGSEKTKVVPSPTQIPMPGTDKS